MGLKKLNGVIWPAVAVHGLLSRVTCKGSRRATGGPVKRAAKATHSSSVVHYQSLGAGRYHRLVVTDCLGPVVIIDRSWPIIVSHP